MTVRLIQVGLGGWGLDWARNVLPGVAAVTPVAFVDSDPATLAHARERLGAADTMLFRSLGAAVRATAADAVLAVVPMAAHAAVSAAALRLGLHVLVEKPFTATLPQATMLAALAATQGRLLMVSQNYRHHPAIVTAAALLRDGSLGRPVGATVAFRKNWQVTNHRYHTIPGPLLLDMAIHHFDLVRLLLGEVARLSCRAWTTPASPFREPAAAEAMLEMASGLIVGYHGTWLSQGAPTLWAGTWAIECERGVLAFTARGNGAGEPDALAIQKPDGSSTAVPLAPLANPDRAGALAAFADAVATGTRPPGLSDARDNIGSLALCFAAMRSARAGGTWVAPAARGIGG